MGGDTTCPSHVVGGQVGSFTLDKSSVQSSVKQPLTLAPTDDLEPQNMQTPEKDPPGIKPTTLLLAIPQWQPLQLSVAQNTVKGSAFYFPLLIHASTFYRHFFALSQISTSISAHA